MPSKKTKKTKETVHKIVLGEKTGDEIIKDHKLKEELEKLRIELETLAKEYASIAVVVNKLGFKIHMNPDGTAALYRDVVRELIGEIKQCTTVP